MSFRSLCIPEPEEEGMADDFPDVEDPKQERSVTMASPLVRPMELSGKDEQMAAEQSLKLVEKMDAVKLQSYLDLEFKKYLETCPTDASTSKKETTTEYAKVLESSPSAVKQVLPAQAPPKFAAPQYYAALRERVKKKAGEESRLQQNTDQAGPTGADAELQQKNTRSDSSGTAHVSRAAPKASQTGIDALMSGETVASPKKKEEEKLQYKSTLEILKYI